MTEVEFHTGVADPVRFACRLLRKAARTGARVLVVAPPATLGELDLALWTFEPTEFVAHVRQPGARPAVAARTPIWLAAGRSGLDDAPGVVVNLGADAPGDPDAIERLIEIVGTGPDAVDGGRRRWRRYKAAGLAIVHHAQPGSAG